MNLIHICATIYVDIVSKPLGQVLQELKLLVGKLFPFTNCFPRDANVLGIYTKVDLRVYTYSDPEFPTHLTCLNLLFLLCKTEYNNNTYFMILLKVFNEVIYVEHLVLPYRKHSIVLVIFILCL